MLPDARTKVRTCTIMLNDGLNIRSEPNSSASSEIVRSYPKGAVLSFVSVVPGERIDGNPWWGYSVYGNYFWMGGTDLPYG